MLYGNPPRQVNNKSPYNSLKQHYFIHFRELYAYFHLYLSETVSPRVIRRMFSKPQAGLVYLLSDIRHTRRLRHVASRLETKCLPRRLHHHTNAMTLHTAQTSPRPEAPYWPPKDIRNHSLFRSPRKR